MDVLDAVYQRRSVREYTGEPVTRDVVDRLIDAAIHAPSAVNRQPWFFTVIQDQELLDGISRDAKELILANAAPLGSTDHFHTLLSNPEYHIFYHAPALIVISALSEERWAVEDCSLAAENLMLAACAMGLGSCWIGFAQGFLESPEGMKLIELSPEFRPVAPIIVGHPKTLRPPVSRKRPRVHWIRTTVTQ